MSKSLFLRLNTGWSFSCSRNTMSPGSPLGCSSLMPRNRIFSPFFMPRSMFTSSTWRSFFFWQLVPVALQVAHCCCSCWTMPGPICRSFTVMPFPLQSRQVSGVPTILSRDTANFAVLPLYKSSRET